MRGMPVASSLSCRRLLSSMQVATANRHVYMVLVMRPLSAGENGLDSRFLESFSL
jgi:hypothetical protein